MSLLPAINEIAKASVLTDEQDLPALVGIHERLRSLCTEMATSDMTIVTECLEHAAGLIEKIVCREAENGAAALDMVRRGIEYAQRVVVADQEGRPLGEIGPSPYSGESRAPRAGEGIDSDLLLSWVTECGHTLAELETQVMAAASANTPEVLGEIRRRLHTFKGECGVLSLHAAQKLCHEAESCIDRCIADGEALPVDAILALVDWMRGYVAALSENPQAPVPDQSEILAHFLPAPDHKTAPTAKETKPAGANTSSSPSAAVSLVPDQASPSVADTSLVVLIADGDMKDNLNDFLCESREHIAGSEQALLELEKNPRDKELINTVFRAFHTIKGVAGFMNLGPIVSLAHSAEFLLDSARNDKIALNSQYLSIILKTCDLMGQMIRVFEGGSAPTNGQLKSLIDQLERAVKGDLSGASAAEVKGAAPLVSSAIAFTAAPTATSATASAAPSGPASAALASEPPSVSGMKRADQTVKVSTGRMDMLVDMVGELVIAQQMVVQDPAVRGLQEQRLQRNLTMVGKIIRDLQEVSMSLRMVPIKATFQKMARLVRDVSAKAGKHIVLHTEGEDVELDRNVVEEIADPLVHMIRNSCDHGIEASDARRAAGKSETGNVYLRAFHSGGSIVIEIEDDGKGLDRGRIIAKAVEKGLFSLDRPVAEIPDSEIFNLIFLPGFSTAEKVTDLSGRGVGMDVVRRNIEALRGKVDIRSTAGKGTIFSMRLPLTMAIIDGMIVRVGKQRYVIPTLSIERSFRPQPKDIHTVVGKGEMAMVRGSLLPIHRLHQVLGHDQNDPNSRGDLLIVVESQHNRACLAADEIIGQQQVVIKALGQATQSIRGVSGGAILGDGRVALILDIGGILTEATAANA